MAVFVYSSLPYIALCVQGHFSGPPKSCKTWRIDCSKILLLFSEFALRNNGEKIIMIRNTFNSGKMLGKQSIARAET